jgi:hypothetical protein
LTHKQQRAARAIERMAARGALEGFGPGSDQEEAAVNALEPDELLEVMRYLRVYDRVKQIAHYWNDALAVMHEGTFG